MLVVGLFVSIHVASTLACMGCKVKKWSFENCAPGTEKYATVQCADPRLGKDCLNFANCSYSLPQRITSGKVKMSGTFNGLPMTLEYADACEQLRNLKTDPLFGEFATKYEVPPDFPLLCPDEPVTKGFIPVSIQVLEEHKVWVPRFAGISRGKVEVTDINGVKGSRACMKGMIQLDCGLFG